MSVKTEPLRYDNCKECVSRCVHAGKDREFVYRGDKSCKIVKKQTRLDRSAWKPCEFCRERDREVYKTEDYPGICDFEVMLDGPYEITVNAYNHYTPFTEDICFSFPVLFCPKCSRPLTEEAWAMLEKRLEV